MAILCFVVFLTIYCGFVSVLIYCCSSKRIGRIFASKSEIPENRSEISERRQRERNNQTVRENDSLTVNMSNENNEEISQPPPCYEDALKNTKPKNSGPNFKTSPLFILFEITTFLGSSCWELWRNPTAQTHQG